MKKYMNGNLKNPNFFLFIAIFFSAIVLYISGKHTYRVMEDVLENSEHAQIIRARVSNIRFWDEVLTSSTLLAANTSDAKWEKRYRLYEPKLENALSELLKSDSIHAFHQTTKMTDSANIHLMAMEHRVFELIHLNRQSEANDIIAGNEYARQKAIYSEGLSTFINLHELETTRQQMQLQTAANRSKWFFGLAILLLAIVWLPVEHFLRRSRAQMLKQNQELELQVQARKESESALQESRKQIKRTHEQLQESIKASSVGLWEWNMQTNEVYQSPEFKKQIGYIDDEVQSSSEFYFSHLHPEDAIIVNESSQQLFAGVIDQLNLEYRFRHKDGSYLWMLARTSLQRDQYGKPLRLFGSHIDITERKKTEEKLKESEEKYRLLAETSPEMVYLIDTKGYVSYVNKVAAAQFRAPAQELIGKHLKDIFPPDLAQQNLAGIQDVIATKSNFQSEVEMVFPTGNRWIDARLTPVFDEKNCVIGVLGLSYDITERKKAEEKINILAHAVKNSADCIIITNKDNQIIFVNDSFCKTFGFKEDEIVGQPIAVIHSENNLPEVSNDLLSTLAKKEVWTGEVLNKRKDGNDFPVQLSLAPLLTDQGELIAVVGVLRDITERKRAEEELARQQYLMNMLMDFFPDHIYFKDLESRFVKINKSFALLFGLNDPDRAIGKSDFDFFSEEHSRQAYQDEQTIIRTGQPLSMEEKETYHDRPDSWVSTIKMPLFDKDGKISGTFGISKDITKNKLAQEKIKLQNEELQKLNAEKDKFFSIIAHDLKTPFNSIIGFSEILVEQVKEKNYQGIEEYTDIILQSSQRAMDLLMNLMEWSRSQTGKMEFNPAYFQMTELINEVELLLDNAAGQKSIVITNTLPDNIAVYADKNMMSAVLRNLISNAIKFTRPGGEIIISVEEKEELTVSVSDNGIGIPKNRIEQLFRIDENYSTYGTQNERGTGLGLILCKEFIEKHGGKIWVESEEGKGSIFYFTIP